MQNTDKTYDRQKVRYWTAVARLSHQNRCAGQSLWRKLDPPEGLDLDHEIPVYNLLPLMLPGFACSPRPRSCHPCRYVRYVKSTLLLQGGTRVARAGMCWYVCRSVMNFRVSTLCPLISIWCCKDGNRGYLPVNCPMNCWVDPAAPLLASPGYQVGTASFFHVRAASGNKVHTSRCLRRRMQ
jgi:hypothetical protein